MDATEVPLFGGEDGALPFDTLPHEAVAPPDAFPDNLLRGMRVHQFLLRHRRGGSASCLQETYFLTSRMTLYGIYCI